MMRPTLHLPKIPHTVVTVGMTVVGTTGMTVVGRAAGKAAGTMAEDQKGGHEKSARP
jgi:hypothetical protein